MEIFDVSKVPTAELVEFICSKEFFVFYNHNAVIFFDSMEAYYYYDSRSEELLVYSPDDRTKVIPITDESVFKGIPGKLVENGNPLNPEPPKHYICSRMRQPTDWNKEDILISVTEWRQASVGKVVPAGTGKLPVVSGKRVDTDESFNRNPRLPQFRTVPFTTINR